VRPRHQVHYAIGLILFALFTGSASGQDKALARWRAQRIVRSARSSADGGRYREAAKLFEQALASYRAIGDTDGTSVALHSLALCLGHLGEERRAVALLEESLSLSRSLGRPDYQAADLKALGDAQMQLLRWGVAQNSLQQALVLARETGDFKGQASALLSLSTVHRQLGDLGRALAQGAEACQIYARTADFEGLEAADFRLGDQYLVGGDLARALDQFGAALAAARVTKDSLGEAAALYGLGDAQVIAGNPESAKKLYLASLGKLTEHGGEPFRSLAVASRLLDLLLARGELDEAAQWIARTGGDPFYQGRLEFARGHFAVADKQLTLALNKTSGVAPWDVEVAFRTFRGLAREASGRFDAALADFTAAASRLESVRETEKADAGFFRPQERGVSRLEPLQGAVRAAWRLGQVEQAFQWSEHTKARSLTEALARAEAIDHPEPVAARNVVLRPKEVLISYEVMAPYTLAFVVCGGRVRKVVEIPVGREELEKRIRYFRNLMTSKSSSADALEPGRRLYRLLLEETLAETTPDDKILIVPDESLGLLSFEALPEPSPQGTVYVGYRRVLTYWQSATFLSMVRRSSRRIEGDRVLVVADPVFNNADPRAHPVEGTRAESEPAVLQIRREITRGAVRHLGWDGFRRLPSTSRFVKSLAGLYGERLQSLVGPAATEDAIEQEDLRPFGRAIVFATHGFVDDEIPYFRQAALVLSNPEALGRRDGEGGDGYLTMSEIMRLRMPTELVAALACSTGSGELVSGEGVMGLGRAFQYAGARSVLVSLWNVDDESTNQFGEAVLTALEQGRDKDEALLAARRHLRQRGYEHPYYWAAFILIGERDRAPSLAQKAWPRTRKGEGVLGWLAFVTLLVVSGLAGLWQRARKRSAARWLLPLTRIRCRFRRKPPLFPTEGDHPSERSGER
jgi:CHAT domain-containing protein